MSRPDVRCNADACQSRGERQYLGEDGTTVWLCRIHRQMSLFNMPFRLRGKIVQLVFTPEELAS